MSEPLFDEKLHMANKLGLRNKKIPLPDRLADLPQDTINKLGCFAILNQSVSFEGISVFFDLCGFLISSNDEIDDWVLFCVEKGLVQTEKDNDTVFFFTEEEVRSFFEEKLSEEIKSEYHLNADRFYISWLTDIAIKLQIGLPESEEARRIFFIGPYGLLDSIAHSPQFQITFISALKVAVSWQEHLFQIQKFEEAAAIVNMICFALARQGERPYAEALLIRCTTVTKEVPNLVARVNLATLLREEAKLKSALRLYEGTIFGLLKNKAYQQLVVVISEIGAIHRLNGHLLTAAITLEICSLLHGILKNSKSQAIARSQLASVYRYARIYGLALRVSKLACNYFRANMDYLNLGRSLVTRGNIFYNLKSTDQALKCFDESLSIGQMISDPQSICGALSGKGRVLMLMNNLTEAKQILDEVISVRERNSDHTVGVEYQNMGYFYELIGNLPVALVWYNKALKVFRQYMPVEIAPCEQKISKLERQLRNSNYSR